MNTLKSYEKFEALLATRGITSYEVAKQTGIATSTLTGWKQGKYTPKLPKLKVLADFFNVPIEHFL